MTYFVNVNGIKIFKLRGNVKLKRKTEKEIKS